MRMRESIPAKIAITVGAAVAAAGIATAVAGHAHASCQYLGTNYPVQYDCTQNQPWLPYGTVGNPPNTGPYPGANCALPMNRHNMGCS